MQEAVISTSDEDTSAVLWDLKSSAVFANYRPIQAAKNTLCFLSLDYMMLGLKGKGVSQTWSWKKESFHMKHIIPEPLTCMAASPDGLYCAGGSASGKGYFWMTSTGSLLQTWEMHYKAVSCVKFSDDGMYIVSGGQDGLVQVWGITSLTSNMETSIKPHRVWSSHSLPITSLVIGLGGSRAHVYTTSLDRTCKIFDLASGVMIRSLLIPTYATCCAIDAAENAIYIGGGDGNIYPFSFHGSNEQMQSTSESIEISRAFVGQGSPITCMAMSIDAITLVTGTQSGAVHVWDIPSRQITKIFKHHKGEITNIATLFRPETLPSSSASDENRAIQELPLTSLKKFRDHDSNSFNTFNNNTNESTVSMRLCPKRKLAEVSGSLSVGSQVSFITLQNSTASSSTATQGRLVELEEELRETKSQQKHWEKTCQQMYRMCVDLAVEATKKTD